MMRSAALAVAVAALVASVGARDVPENERARMGKRTLVVADSATFSDTHSALLASLEGTAHSTGGGFAPGFRGVLGRVLGCCFCGGCSCGVF